MTVPGTDVRLVLGGARSGKTALALRRAEGLGPRRLYVATGEARDAEMAARIDRHRRERGAGWETSETPLGVAAILHAARGYDALLVDCLTLWLTNVMLAGKDVAAARVELCAALGAAACPVLLVSNEVGLGLVPETPLGRRFRDEQGRLNQEIAAIAREVVFVAAGLPLVLKRDDAGPGSAEAGGA